LADGSIDVSRVPDFIPATNGDRTAGWIASRDVFPAERDHMPEVITVFADDLQIVVGHMYPGVGFVPLGREEEMLPPPGQDRDLTITIRNDWDRPAILEVIEPPDEVEGRPPARYRPRSSPSPAPDASRGSAVFRERRADGFGQRFGTRPPSRRGSLRGQRKAATHRNLAAGKSRDRSTPPWRLP
jgi:hypothetical protein